MPGRVWPVILIFPVFLVFLILPGCYRETPQEPERSENRESSPSLVVSGDLAWRGWGEPIWPQGRSHWHWRELDRDQAGPRKGTARLKVWSAPEGIRTRWIFRPVPSVGSKIELVPVDAKQWHSFRWLAGRGVPVPLPRQLITSAYFDDLLDLLQTLTLPHFDRVVTHWPAWPVPVRCRQFISGQVDLSECLREAMAAWNEGLPSPLFEPDEGADWGVRLVHFPGIQLQPPLQARITRLRPDGAPQIVQIRVGGNYDQPWDRIYAVRGMVHELGHALFMWGHSPDREHCLWERGPPQVDVPAPDEKEAVRWWHGLTEGMDLGNYGRLSAPGCSKASSRPADRPAGIPQPASHPGATDPAGRR